MVLFLWKTPGRRRYHLCAYNFAGQGRVTNEWLHFMVVLEDTTTKPCRLATCDTAGRAACATL